MGLFYEQIQVVNRTSDRDIEIMYDGQRMVIKPSYDAEGKRIPNFVQTIPRQCAAQALDQSVIPGTESALDPSVYESMIGLIDPKRTTGRNGKTDPKKLRPWHNVSYLSPDMFPQETTRVPLAEIIEEFVRDPKAVVQVRTVRTTGADSGGGRLFDVRGSA